MLITKCLDLGREAEFLAAAPSLSPCRSTQWNLKRLNICIIFIIFIRIILSLSLYPSMSIHTVELEKVAQYYNLYIKKIVLVHGSVIFVNIVFTGIRQTRPRIQRCRGNRLTQGKHSCNNCHVSCLGLRSMHRCDYHHGIESMRTINVEGK